MSNSVEFKNMVSIQGGGNEVLNGLIGDLFDQDDISAQYNTDLMAKLGLTYTRPLNIDETFDVMVGMGDLDEVNEGEDLPTIDVSKGKGKGFQLKTFGGQFPVTKQFMKWAEASQTLEGADSSVKKEWSRLAQNIKGLDRSKIKTKNKLFAELLVNSRKSDQAFWPGSLTPYGQPLISASHPYLNGTMTFSNYAGDLALSAADATAIATSRGYIKTALNKIKNDLRLQNGDYVEEPSEYEIHVPRALVTTVREILNDGSKFSGEGSNANTLNVFAFEGSRLKIVQNDTIGSYDKRGNMIGTTTMWFIYNREGAMKAQAARYIELYNAEIDVYKNDSNKNHYVSIDMSCTVDHYGLETFIVGANIPA